jgi:hypothetical protein
LIFFIYFHTFSWLWLKPWKTGLNSSNFRIYILINEWTGFHENQSKAGFTGLKNPESGKWSSATSPSLNLTRFQRLVNKAQNRAAAGW